jgi:hypothetical protein
MSVVVDHKSRKTSMYKYVSRPLAGITSIACVSFLVTYRTAAAARKTGGSKLEADFTI